MMHLLVIYHNKMTTAYAVIIGLGCVFVVYIIVYFVLLARSRKRVRLYNDFVYDCYTKENTPTPSLILRIQNQNIRQYNTLCRHGIGRLFNFSQIPEFQNTMNSEGHHQSPPKTCR